MVRSLLVLLLIAALYGQTQTAADAMHAIVADLHAGNYSEARTMLDQQLKEFPGNASLWTLRGYALSRLGDPKEALVSYNRAITISPDYLPALEGAAEIEYAASDQHAVPLLEKILKIHPDDPTSHAMLASLAYKRGDCATAAKEFSQSPSLIESKVEALEEYGSCLVKLRRSGEAIPIFQRLCELHPEDDKARYNLAVVQSLAKQYRETIATLNPVVSKNPRDTDSLDLLAEAYEASGDTPHAVEALRQAIVTNPDATQYYLDFTNICLVHGSYQVGIDMLNAGLKRQPDAARLYLARGILYIQLGEYDKSEKDFADADRIDPNLQFGTAVQGLAELQRNDLGQAEATLRSRIQKQPNDPFLRYLLAETLARKGAAVGSPDFNEAVKSAEKALELQPNFVLARDVLGRLYLEEGKTAQAIEQSRLAFRDAPDDQTALYHLILALRKGNQTEEIPALAKKLGQLRKEARAKEAAEHKYSLIEVNPDKP